MNIYELDDICIETSVTTVRKRKDTVQKINRPEGTIYFKTNSDPPAWPRCQHLYSRIINILVEHALTGHNPPQNHLEVSLNSINPGNFNFIAYIYVYVLNACKVDKHDNKHDSTTSLSSPGATLPTGSRNWHSP